MIRIDGLDAGANDAVLPILRRDQWLPGGGGGLPGRLAPGADFFGYLDRHSFDGDDFDGPKSLARHRFSPANGLLPATFQSLQHHLLE